MINMLKLTELAHTCQEVQYAYYKVALLLFFFLKEKQLSFLIKVIQGHLEKKGRNIPVIQDWNAIPSNISLRVPLDLSIRPWSLRERGCELTHQPDSSGRVESWD